jgi:heme-degrading monooxygenase HmoA
MPYACSYEVPASIEMYREVRRLIGDEPAIGMLAHLVVRSESGLRHLEVWESEEAWQRFRENRVVPAVHTALRAAGLTEMPPEPLLETLELVDVQLGS